MVILTYARGIKNGAGVGTRTQNLLITNQLLCRLSYAGRCCSIIKHGSCICKWYALPKFWVSKAN